jgi:hypothetical protein
MASDESMDAIITGGRLYKLVGKEAQTGSFMGRRVATTAMRISLLLVSEGPIDRTSLTASKNTFATVATTSPLIGLYAAATLEQVRKSARGNTLGSDTFDSLVAQLAALPNPTQQQAAAYYLKFRALVYLHPETCARVAALLAATDAHRATFKILASALAGVDSRQSQAALLAVVRARTSDEAAMVTLIPALGFYHNPARQTQDALVLLAKDSPYPTIASTALLAMGSMARNLLHSDVARSDEIVDALLASARSANDGTYLDQSLLALGNSAAPRALEALAGYAGSRSADVRANAIEALRFMQNPKAARIMRRAASSDANSDVRRAALRALRYQPVSAETVAMEDQVVAKDASAEVRWDAISNLWSVHGQYPAVKRTISRAATHDPSANIRKAAKDIISANPSVFGVGGPPASPTSSGHARKT